MDVVQSVLHRLKASISVETRPGQGTTFRLKLPLTLAIIKALLFWVEQRLYAIPLNAVLEIARTFETEVHQVDNYEVLQLRNQVLPLLRLGRPADDSDRKSKLFVLVITVGERKYGLIVDALEGEEELVIKALDDQTFATDLVSGASILGDGRVVLILNLPAVVEHVARSAAAGNRTGEFRFVADPHRPRAACPKPGRRRPGMKKNPIRVLVVDDSALMRKLIPQMLAADDSIEVVGTAMDGTFCLKKIEELKPNVVTLDLEMPGMNGIDTLKEIMRRQPVPVIVFSSHSTEGASVTMKALGLGAFDFVTKPKDATAHMAETARELIGKVKAAADCKLKPRMLSGIPPKPKKLPVAPGAPNKVIAIGVSTGGPQALEYVLSQLPGDFPGTIAVVQHMPDGFTDMFARRLDEVCPLRVKEAQSGDILQTGRVLICPGSRHMKVKRLPLGDIIVLSDEPRVNGHRPSADVLLRSVAEEFKTQAIGVLMTGMGDDGAEGLGAVKKEGGMTIAQSEDSCVVYGMPKAAIERGYAIRVVGLDVMGATLQALCGRNAGSMGASGRAVRAGN